MPQPKPIEINCAGQQPYRFCENGGVPESFCEKKADGNYEHPSLCDSFIYCVNKRQEIRKCPLYLGFNPKRGICDWPGLYRCVTFNRGNICF